MNLGLVHHSVSRNYQRHQERVTRGRRRSRPSMDQVAGTWRSATSWRWRRRSAVATWEVVLHPRGCHCGEQHHVERSSFVVFVIICMIYVILMTMAMIGWATKDRLTLRTSCSLCAALGDMKCDSFESGFSSPDFRSFCLVDFPLFSNIFLICHLLILPRDKIRHWLFSKCISSSNCKYFGLQNFIHFFNNSFFEFFFL